MTVEQYLEEMKPGFTVPGGSDAHLVMHEMSQKALQITMELNNKYHTHEEIIQLMSELTGHEIDDSFGMFPPFYTDCGRNIHIGKNVFINAGCKFQDQGGITIGDGTLVGHNVTIATLNHDYNPNNRASITPKPVKIGKNVWIGSDSTILPGVEIGDGAIIGAGSVVTKSIPANTIAAGNPARIIRKIENCS